MSLRGIQIYFAQNLLVFPQKDTPGTAGGVYA